MKRQALQISIMDLFTLYLELSEEAKEQEFDMDKKFQINIINKTPECSDTWELEDPQ